MINYDDYKTITTNDGQVFYYVTEHLVTTKEGLPKAIKQLEIVKEVLDKSEKYGFDYHNVF